MWNRNFNPSPSRRALQSHNTLLDFPRARAVAAIDIGMILRPHCCMTMVAPTADSHGISAVSTEAAGILLICIGLRFQERVKIGRTA